MDTDDGNLGGPCLCDDLACSSESLRRLTIPYGDEHIDRLKHGDGLIEVAFGAGCLAIDRVKGVAAWHDGGLVNLGLGSRPCFRRGEVFLEVAFGQG